MIFLRRTRGVYSFLKIIISFVSGTRVETPKENAKGVVLENVM